MIKYIKRYIFARKVCKKYGLSFTSVLTRKLVGAFWYSGCIEVSLFHPRFYAVFLHELSHYLDYKISDNYSTMSYINRAMDKTPTTLGCYRAERTKNRLYCEARANRYSMRLLKVLGLKSIEDEPFLRKCMTTYVVSSPLDSKGNLNKFNIADIDYKINKYLTY